MAGTSGDPLRVIGSLPGVSADRLAGRDLRRARRQPRQHRLLPGRHARAGAVPPRARPVGDSPVPDRAASTSIPGGYPAHFGGFVSGIMAARTTAPPADRVHASADVTVYDAGGIMTAPWNGGRGTVAVAARYSYTGALFSAAAGDSHAALRRLPAARRPPARRRAGDGVRVRIARRARLAELRPAGVRARCSSTASTCAGGARWAAGGCSVATRSAPTGRARRCSTARSGARAVSVAPRLVYERTLRRAVDLQAGGDAQRAGLPDASVPDFGRRPSDLGAVARRVHAGRVRDAVASTPARG